MLQIEEKISGSNGLREKVALLIVAFEFAELLFHFGSFHALDDVFIRELRNMRIRSGRIVDSPLK